MLTQHNTGTIPAWNKKNVKTGSLNRSSAGVTHVRPDVTHVTPDASHVTPNVTHVTPDASHATPNVTHVTPHVSHVTPNVTHVTPYASHVTPNASHVTPDASHVTHVTPNVTHVTPHASHVTPNVTYVTPHASHVTPDASHVTPNVTHVTPDASHVTPNVTHVTPDASHETPNVTHVTPDASHATPNVTPSASHVTPNATHVTPDASHVTPDASHVTPHASHVTPDVSNATHVTPNATYITPDHTQEKRFSPDAVHILSQNFHPCLKVSSKLDDPFVFRHPFTMLLAGPTSCGKTTWMKHLLQQAETMIKPPPKKISWFCKRWQPAYSELQEIIPFIEIMQGIGQRDPDGQPTLYIYDDHMKDTTKNVDIYEMYTEGSHHCNLSVICLLQNLYHRGKENRTMNLNTQYIVLFKNPRDQQQVAHLARQMYPKNSHMLLDAFRDATQEPYRYLLIDLKQDTADKDRLRTSIIKGGGNSKMIQLTTGSEQENCVKKAVEVGYKMDKSHCPCTDCGIIFASSTDLQKHVKRGCPENNQPPVKRLCVENTDEPDESGWHNIVQQVYEKYVEKVDSYENDGYSNLESREKATEDLFWKYRKGIMKQYADILTTLHNLKKSMIHREIMQDIQRLMDEKNYQFAKALKLVLQWNSSLFDELIDSEEEDDNSSFDSESTDVESDSQTEDERPEGNLNF